MTAEFDWWLLLVGLVIGAGLVWLILAELPRRDAELRHAEMAVEAAWISATLAADGLRMDAGEVAAVLRQHRAYLKLPPPDDAPAVVPALASASIPGRPAAPEPGAERAVAPAPVDDGPPET
jgi:hypothetical protein